MLSLAFAGRPAHAYGVSAKHDAKGRSMRTKRSRTYCLCALAVVGVMAMSASSAEAVPWEINGSALVGSETVSGTVAENAKLLVPGLGIELTCKKETLVGKISNSPVQGHGEASLLLLECSVAQVEEVCEVGQPSL